MIFGTAGLTAALSILKLTDHGLREGAEILVTGGSGGVGSSDRIDTFTRRLPGYRGQRNFR